MAELKKDFFEDLKNSPYPHYDSRNKRTIITYMLRHLRPDMDTDEIEKYLPLMGAKNSLESEKRSRFSIYAPELLYSLVMYSKPTEQDRKRKFIFVHKPETQFPSNRAPYSGISYLSKEKKRYPDSEDRKTIVSDFTLFKELSIITEKPMIIGYEKTYTGLTMTMLEKIALFYRRLRTIGRALPQKKRKIENITSPIRTNPMEKFASQAEKAYFKTIIEYCYYSLSEYLWITRSWSEHLKLIRQGLIGPEELLAILSIIYSNGVHSGELMKLFRSEGIPVEVYQNASLKSMGYLISFLLYASLFHDPVINEFFTELGIDLLNSDTFLEKLPSQPT